MSGSEDICMVIVMSATEKSYFSQRIRTPRTRCLCQVHVEESSVELYTVNYQNEAGWTPLHACCHAEETASVDWRECVCMI